MIIYTGDIHGDITPIYNFINTTKIDKKQIEAIVILGDAGLNFYLDGRDAHAKRLLERLGVNIFCVHGNHEARPQSIDTYRTSRIFGANAWVEDLFPHIFFAQDGEIYNLEGMKTIVIGGAYSVDKYYRLENNWPWFSDEQPDEATKNKVLATLAKNDWKIDQILSHTCPMKFEPKDQFLPNIDQSTVDTSTEEWLDEIENKTDYKRWLCGHWHIDRDLGNFHFLMYRFLSTEDLDLLE